jgi:hypothetical protein
MSKRNRKSDAAATGGRGRSVPIKIDKPKPWGTIAVGVVLAVALIGIIAYAVANTGSGVRNLLQEEDDSFRPAGLVVEDNPARDHVQTGVQYPDYPARPPLGGQHNPLPQQCAVYTEEIPAEHALHSMEHGAAWVTYSPDLPADQVETLTDLVDGNPYRLLSPLPGQESPVILTAWGRQLALDSADDDDVERFLRTYTNGRQTLERGAACAGNQTTGSLPVAVAPTDPNVMPEPSPAGEPVEEGAEEPAEEQPAS